MRKKKKPETSLAFEICRELKNKLRISLAINVLLFVTVILKIIFS